MLREQRNKSLCLFVMCDITDPTPGSQAVMEKRGFQRTIGYPSLHVCGDV